MKIDSPDLAQLRLLRNLSPAKRLRVMLEAREFAVAMIRARLKRRFPKLSAREINLLLIQETSNVNRTRS